MSVKTLHVIHRIIALKCCLRLGNDLVHKNFFKVFIEFVTILLLFYVLGIFGRKACGILFLQPGIEPTPPALESEVPTTGLPGKSLVHNFLNQWGNRLKLLNYYPKLPAKLRGRARAKKRQRESTLTECPSFAVHSMFCKSSGSVSLLSIFQIQQVRLKK